MEAQLTEYVEQIAANGVRQRTAEWHKQKKYTVGGSSIATIMGTNKFETIEGFVRAKITPPVAMTAEDSIAMNWGTIFEDVLCLYLEMTRGCKIMATELYYKDSEKWPNMSYSPDGLGIYDVICDTIEIETPTDTGYAITYEHIRRPEIVLFEFKCPFSRIPTGGMPSYYVPQVKMGLELMEIAKVGIFIEAVFRRCAMAQYGPTPDYDKTISARNGTKLTRGAYGANPLAYGIIGFTEPGPLNGPPIDLGAVDKSTLGKILHRAANGFLDVVLLEINIADGDKKRIIERDVTYILPWKLFRVDTHQVEPTPGFLSKYTPKIQKIMDFVNEAHTGDKNITENDIAQFLARLE